MQITQCFQTEYVKSMQKPVRLVHVSLHRINESCYGWPATEKYYVLGNPIITVMKFKVCFHFTFSNAAFVLFQIWAAPRKVYIKERIIVLLITHYLVNESRDEFGFKDVA